MRKVDPEKHEARRQEILAAAGACFAEKGFHRTSTAEIGERVGMSPGNLFHYFPTKHAIIAAIVEDERRQTAAHFVGIGEAEDQFAELLGFLDSVLDLAGDPAYLSLTLEIAAEAIRDKRIGALVTEADAEMQAALAALLRQAAGRGQIDATLDPADGAWWIAALIDGVFSRAAVDPGFRPSRQRDMLRLLATRFLRPGAGM